MHVWYKPFHNEDFDALETYSLLTSCMSLLFAAYVGFTAGNENKLHMRRFVSMMVILANLAFIIAFCKQLGPSLIVECRNYKKMVDDLFSSTKDLEVRLAFSSTHIYSLPRCNASSTVLMWVPVVHTMRPYGGGTRGHEGAWEVL